MHKRKSTIQEKWILVRYILITGFVVGLLDGIMAVIQNPAIKPEIIFRYISSGLVGQKAYSEGGFFLFGILLHFGISLLFTLIYFLISRRIAARVQIRYWWLLGMFYGVLIWLIMNFIVIPYSFIGQNSLSLSKILGGLAIHMLFVGMPIAYGTMQERKVRRTKEL